MFGMPSMSLSSSEKTSTDSKSSQGSGGGGGGQRGIMFSIATGASKLTSATSADAGGVPVWVWVAMAGGALAMVWAFIHHRR